MPSDDLLTESLAAIGRWRAAGTVRVVRGPTESRPTVVAWSAAEPILFPDRTSETCVVEDDAGQGHVVLNRLNDSEALLYYVAVNDQDSLWNWSLRMVDDHWDFRGPTKGRDSTRITLIGE